MINITSLTQPASPNSRRSSSISALALYNTAVTSTYTNPNNPIHNNSTVVNLYTRQYIQKKKFHRWRLVRTPIPLNPVYRKTLFLAILIPFIVTYKMNEIIGIVVHSDKHITSTENTPKHLSRETITPRLFTRNKYTFTRHEWIQLVEHGDLLDDTQDDEMNRNLWLIMNLQAGIWTMCFRLAEMQNNIISCVVVVYLSVAASVLIGAFSTLFRAVPAAMVTGVLYITSGVFIIFANCIHHTKLNRLEYEWGPCYPISQIPRTLYNPDIISVHPLWPVLVSWISSFVFFIASIIWLILTQLMTFENSKTMI
ncbi:hypothetical protein Smp_158170 [Schistosoma mansoni]|uniref:hypothetical protein n=1 Tax=Schistosoma mansoni TaxID=6183 RepID=UPI00019B3873|nr:hypothetical protein Smp_158170 [Schistosoma mansoni]|eukprot:XP_018653109.1 hypothetical protein Smp_158170 [Schistosoma mansoni]